MKPSFIPVNDWRLSDLSGGAVDLITLGFDYGRGHFYFRFRLLGFGFAVGRYTDYAKPADEYAADDVPHPFADPDALTGNITSPIGAQSGSFLDEVVQLNELEHAGKLSEAEVDAAIARAKNWVSQEDGS